jgi:hypothetical protein
MVLVEIRGATHLVPDGFKLLDSPGGPHEQT